MSRPAEAVLKPVAGFARGVRYPFGAARFLLRRPSLLRYLVIPFLINLLVFSVTVYFGFNLFQDLLSTYAPGTDVWYGLLFYYLAWIVALILTAVLVFFTFTVIGNLIASPFNEVLSERAEQLISGRQQTNTESGQFWRDARRSLVVELKKMSFFVVGMLLLFSLNLLPGIGALLYALLAPLLTLFFLVVEYLAFVLMRKQMSFAEQRRYVVRRPMLMAGFGCGVFCLLAIPFLQFFCIPLAVVGATQLWCDFPAE